MESDFQKRVYSLARKIPKGKVTTYGRIAKRLRTFPRAVGNALNRNPYSYVAISSEAIGNRRSALRGDSKRNNGFFLVPCHRVVKSTGEIGGFASGTKNKIKILKKEGVEVTKGIADFGEFGFDF
jgi:methylated-DNA-[protein]-cysteine S-methyltransferase